MQGVHGHASLKCPVLAAPQTHQRPFKYRTIERQTRGRIDQNRGERNTLTCGSTATVGETEAFVADVNELITVAGASGGVGQLVTAKLIERGYRVRAIARSAEKAKAVFGEKPDRGLQVMTGDLRSADFARQAVLGSDAVICCLGTTAFPSLRWRGGSPEDTDYTATVALIENAPETIARFVLTSSVGVDRFDQLPFSILNAFGVLKQKKRSEQKLIASGLPYTIVRPGRLTDGPYTSLDLNTLLKATSGARQSVQLSAKDDQQDEASRIAVAEAIVQLLKVEKTVNKTFSITSKGGDGPEQDPKKWRELLEAVNWAQ